MQQSSSNLISIRRQLEIIAVVIIVGILAAVAIPKYLSLQEEVRKMAALRQIAEVKGRLSLSMVKYMLQNNGAKPGAVQLLTVTGADGKTACAAMSGEDVQFTCTASGAAVIIAVWTVKGVKVSAVRGNPGTFEIRD